MDKNMLGMKDLYDVQLRANYPLTINGVEYEEGEPFVIFESIQVGVLQESRKKVEATGGYNNKSWITWDMTTKVTFNLQQGVLSKTHLALLSNSKIKEVEAIEVPKTEKLFINEDYQINLKYAPIDGTLYIYKEDSGEKITDYSIDNKTITFNDFRYENVMILYSFIYENLATNIVIGERLINGYIELVGKTRLRDDNTGLEHTGVIKIPRMRLASELSMKLGKDMVPMTGNFTMTGHPEGNKGSEKVMDFFILNNDIDADK